MSLTSAQSCDYLPVEVDSCGFDAHCDPSVVMRLVCLCQTFVQCASQRTIVCTRIRVNQSLVMSVFIANENRAEKCVKSMPVSKISFLKNNDIEREHAISLHGNDKNHHESLCTFSSRPLKNQV